MPSLRAVLGYDSAVYKARYTCIAVNSLHQHFPAAALQASSAIAFVMSVPCEKGPDAQAGRQWGLVAFAVYKSTFAVHKGTFAVYKGNFAAYKVTFAVYKGTFAVYKGIFAVYKAKEHACCECSQKQTVDRM